MSTSVTVSLTGLNRSPFVSGAKHVSIRRWVNLLMELATGRFKGGVKCTVADAAVAASGTVTFSGPLSAADTITINGTAITAQESYARGVATAASVSAADTVTVGSVTFTAVSSGATGNQFNCGGTDTATATSLAGAINANATTAALVKAYSSAAVVTVRNLVIGTAGNHAGASAVTLTSSNGTRLAITGTSSSKLDGASDPGNNLFDMGNTTAEVLANFAAAVAASSTAVISGPSGVTATTDGATIATLTAKTLGSVGNNMTLAKSASNASVSAARLSGGAETSYSFTF